MIELETLKDGVVLSVADQLRIMEKRKHLVGCREDARFKDVWIKGDGTVMAVRDMSLEHMCMTIGLWLRKEFEANESQQLGFRISAPSTYPLVSAYDNPEVWLTRSESIQTTPSLKTMLERIQSMDGGMDVLHSILEERVKESLVTAHSVPEHYLFTQPVFF